MSNYQQMIENLTESYVAMLDKSQDEQEWLENEVLNRLKTKSQGIKFNDLRGALTDVIRPAFNEDTGTFEFVNDAQLEYSSTLAELAEGIRALHPAPASQPYTVPDELSGKSFEYIANKFQVSLSEAQWILVGWNACRAAMLQSGNSPVVLDGSVPEGYALVPSTIYLDESDIESICSQCGDGGGNYGDFTRGILWVGNIQDDEGNITHGLHISSDDYPEEGGITLAKFAAAPQHKGE